MRDPKGRCGRRKTSAPPFVLLLLAISHLLPVADSAAGEVHAADGPVSDPAYVQELIDAAEQQRLHEDPYWRILLHYKRTVLGLRSLVDDPDFFLAENGKRDPRAELEATLRGFFQADETVAAETVCRFIARFTWLRECLGFDPARLPASTCPAFEQVLASINPKSATLVFPTSYMNSPASMFGHTLISVETTVKSKLMSHAVNYSAVNVDRNGILFAVKGIFGFYEGYFSILPYYQKVEEYSDINQRDIWEYPLHLTEEEVVRMLRHLWELQEIYSYYFFFGENCSYTLLFLLDAARPSLRLTDGFRLWVMPIDTIRKQKKKGLIDEADYRPARATRIRYIISLLDVPDQKLALAVYEGKLDPEDLLRMDLAPLTKVRILDLVMEYVQFRYAEKDLTKEEYVDRFLAASKARARLGNPPGAVYEIPRPVQPELGHKSNRLSIGAGARGWNDLEETSLFQEIRIRPTYHDLLDSDRGYIPGSQIEFFSGRLRYYSDEEKLVLERLDLINILSLAPRNRFFKPISWKVSTGLRQFDIADGDRSLAYYLSAGGGVAYEVPGLGLCHGTLEAEVAMGGGLRNLHAVGFGATLGVLRQVLDFWKAQLYLRPYYYPLGEKHLSVEWGLQQQYTVTRNLAVSADLIGKHAHGRNQADASVLLHMYF